MYLIDTHTHIYLSEFEEDLEPVMKRAREAGVETMFLPAIDSSTHETMIQVEQHFPVCKAMMGLHPCSVNQDYEKEVQRIREYLSKRDFVKEQYEAFHVQVKIALEWDLPISIHSRNAIDECIGVVSGYPGLKGVFHCFSGNYEQARKVMDLGFMMGIGGVVTFKNSGLDKVIERTGLENVILETDAPYLAPVPFRGKRNEPSYTRLVAEKLSSITGKSFEEVAELTTRNALELFKSN
jgi:TatD DNase family protein